VKANDPFLQSALTAKARRSHRESSNRGEKQIPFTRGQNYAPLRDSRVRSLSIYRFAALIRDKAWVKSRLRPGRVDISPNEVERSRRSINRDFIARHVLAIARDRLRDLDTRICTRAHAHDAYALGGRGSLALARRRVRAWRFMRATRASAVIADPDPRSMFQQHRAAQHGPAGRRLPLTRIGIDPARESADYADVIAADCRTNNRGRDAGPAALQHRAIVYLFRLSSRTILHLASRRYKIPADDAVSRIR